MRKNIKNNKIYLNILYRNINNVVPEQRTALNKKKKKLKTTFHIVNVCINIVQYNMISSS